MPGAGTVLHTTGMYVEDLDIEGLFYRQAGPVFDEWTAGGAQAVCSLFGPQGRVTLNRSAKGYRGMRCR